jgi:hypothetical protein
VLLAMGLTDAQARSSIRFSLGQQTTEDEIDRAVDAVVQVVRHQCSGCCVPLNDQVRVDSTPEGLLSRAP